MGTVNRQVLKPRMGSALKNESDPQFKAQVVDVPMDFSANAGGNGANLPYYHVDVSQLENFGFIRGVKIDTRGLNTDLCMVVNGAVQEQTNTAPGEGVEFMTFEPGIIATVTITSTQAQQLDFFLANSDPNASAATYGSCVAYLYNIERPHHQTPSKNVAGLIPPASKALLIAATGTQDIVVWGGPGQYPRIFQGARLARPGAVTSAIAGGVKVVINAQITTPVTGVQNFPLVTLYNGSPAAAGSEQIDQYFLGGSLGIYLSKYTTKLQAIATFDQALTAGSFELECLIQDSTNDLAPLT